VGNKFEKIIIVSAGKSNYYTDTLDESVGLQQVLRLIPAVGEAVSNEKNVITWSSALSSNQSTAAYIQQRLGVPCTTEPLLGGSKTVQRETLGAFLSMRHRAIESDATAIIVVIEKSYVNQLIRIIFKEISCAAPEFTTIEDGEVIVLNIRYGTFKKIWSNPPS